ncbi:hypothetical protein Tco_0228351 [Tanacetum coccineum]
MANLSEDIQCAGSDTRPPMLDKTDFASWQQRIRLYCRGKENGVNILKSIDEGPFQMGTTRVIVAEGTEGSLHLGHERPRVYSDLSRDEKDRYNADIRAINIILQGYHPLTPHGGLLRWRVVSRERVVINAIEFLQRFAYQRFEQVASCSRSELLYTKQRVAYQRFAYQRFEQFNKVPVVLESLTTFQARKGKGHLGKTCEDDSGKNIDGKDPSNQLMILGTSVNYLSSEEGSSTENLSESLSNSPCLLILNRINHLPSNKTITLERHLMQGTKLRFKMAELLFKMSVEDTMRTNQGKPFHENNARGNVVAGMLGSTENVQGQTDFKIQTTSKDKMLLMQAREWCSTGRRTVVVSYDNNRKKAETSVLKPISALIVYPPNTPVKLVPRILPTKSQVKINLYVLTQLFTEFDKTCKTRITPTGTSSSNTQKHEAHQKVQQTNIPVIPSTGVNASTEASGSKPRSNTKKNRSVKGLPLYLDLRTVQKYDGESFKAHEFFGIVLRDRQIRAGLLITSGAIHGIWR